MRANYVVEGTLPLGFPHHAVKIVVPEPILHERDQEIAGGRIIQARAAATFPVEVHFSNLFKTGRETQIIGFFKQAISLHSARFGFRNHVRENVEFAQLRRSNVLQG